MELKVEIFAIGKWNGMQFDVTDLNLMASAFSALKDVHKVPLKFGHNEEQPFTDGQPALGWVDEVFVEGSKLFAKFVDIPKVVYNAIEKKLYKHVSVELDMGVEHKGSHYTWVLSGVALLGADIPAVNTLADLTSYMKRDNDLTFKKRVAFTAIDNNNFKESFKMDDLEKALAKVKMLEAQAEATQVQVNNFTKDKVESDALVLSFKAKEELAIKDAKVALFAKAKTDMTDKLESLVKSGTITPAQREKFTSDFRDDVVVIEKLNFALDIMTTGDVGSKGFKKDETSMSNSKDEDEGMQPDEILVNRVNEFMRINPNATFSASRNQVMKADPALAKAYHNMNGEL